MLVVDKPIKLRHDNESIILLLLNVVVATILEKWKINFLVQQPCPVCTTNKASRLSASLFSRTSLSISLPLFVHLFPFSSGTQAAIVQYECHECLISHCPERLSHTAVQRMVSWRSTRVTIPAFVVPSLLNPGPFSDHLWSVYFFLLKNLQNESLLNTCNNYVLRKCIAISSEPSTGQAS